MQPDQQDSVPTNNTDEPNSERPPEMYTPQSIDDSAPVENVENTDEQVDGNEPIHWRASEYIHGEKNGLWFALFAVVVAAFILVDVFFIKSVTFSILVVVMAFSVIVYSRRPPKEIDYTISGDQGLYIGERLYHFSEFKAFGLIRDGEHHSIMLIPIKRFASGVSVYFPNEVGEKIVDILGTRLPMENMKLDAIDVLVRKLRL